ncbi:hypothetical protein ACLMJK_008428 [Lecanora helva]
MSWYYHDYDRIGMPPWKPEEPKSKRRSFLSRILSNKPDYTQTSQPRQVGILKSLDRQITHQSSENVPRKFKYLDRVLNKSVKGKQDVRLVLGWHFDAKETETWSYSLTDEARKIFEWAAEKDLESLVDEETEQQDNALKGS